jgi:hypothetical protein
LFLERCASFQRRSLLLGVGCVVSLAQTTCFIISAFQESQPFLPFLPLELRKEAYLFGRLLGPPQLILFPITVAFIAFENMRRRKDLTPMKGVNGKF